MNIETAVVYDLTTIFQGHTMSTTPMIATILDLERRAEAVIEKAQETATNIYREAQNHRTEVLMSVEHKSAEELRTIEFRAIDSRDRQVGKLRDQLSEELNAVRNISPAHVQQGVEHIIDLLFKS